LVTVAYVAAGRLGLLLAVSPGYATAFFLPSGIAIAAMWMRGEASLPWIFAGSLLLNLWVGYLPNGGLSAAATVGALAIAAASTAQAAAAGFLLRRVIGYPAPLDEAGQLLRFLLVTPLCCLISATLSLLCLWPLGLVTGGDLAGNWVTWWIGDTRGVLVGVPLMFVIAGEPRALWRGRTWTVALPMLLCFALFTLVFIRLSAWETDEQLAEFRLLSQHAADKLEARLEEQEVALEQLQRDFSREAPLSAAEFRSLVHSLLVRFPMVQAIDWAPHVPAAQRAAFEAAQRTSNSDYSIHELTPSGSRQPIGNRPDFYPLTFVEPPQGNDRMLGFDLLSTPDREVAIARASSSGKITATAPIRLVQAQQSGLLLIGHVRGGGNGPGVVVEVLRMGNFVDAVLSPRGGPLNLRLIDIAQARPLYDDFREGAAAPQFRQEFEFGQRRYELQTAPTQTYLAHHSRWESFALLSAGVYGTALLGGLLLLGTGYAHRVRAQVEERTRSLANVNARLEHEIEEREQAEAALRHAHRLEAIGQLTGGIAHDFNNLLTVVSANAELLSASARTEAIRRRAIAILRASTRGARLTRQLLAFSRRQTLRPETVDLRERTAELAEMLSRSLQENIEIKVDLPDQLWPVLVDLAEFELAVLNIAVNARDAMPDGGEFRVAAENVPYAPGEAALELLAGDFVAVRLSDTGSGMASEVLARAFEPYFTTKDIGAGSGLGLSQVYGFAKQSGGEAAIASEPGRGTTVTLYLPRAVTAEEKAVEIAPPRTATG
jgi:signal transduction histidine kinase